jgi:hypothetical protein
MADPKARVEEEEEARASGMRERERETTPAPSGIEQTMNSDSIMVSSRPTRVPDYDFHAVASAASLRHGAPRLSGLLAIGQELAVPRRTEATPRPDLPHRLAVLLFHIDGRSTIAQIARSMDLPAAELVTAFVELAGLGLVELAAPAPR